MSFNKWLHNRESGFTTQIYDRHFVLNRVYHSMAAYCDFNNCDAPDSSSLFGAIFNLEFSTDGHIVAAACEKKSVLLFDSITTKQTHKIIDAHAADVNCIKFLDDRMFASCSDDTTVALWDVRCLKKKVRSLHGHSNWVKNVEYSSKDRLLITAGFDGCVFTWDINSHTELGLLNTKVFHTSGLMRCKLSPDATKLVLSSTGGYLMVVHNLDLTTLHKDLCGFRPNIYRLMQLGQQYIPQAAKFDYVFSKQQKKNRVELITDFPEDDDAEVIYSLQIDPHGRSILSRNITHDEASEWTCVHDIAEEQGDPMDRDLHSGTCRKRKRGNQRKSARPNARRPTDRSSASTSDIVYTIHRRQRNQQHSTHNHRSGGASSLAPSSQPSTSRNSSETSQSNPANVNIRTELVPDIWAAEVTIQERAIRQRLSRNSHSVTGYNAVYPISSGVLPIATLTDQAEREHFNSNSNSTSNTLNTLSSGSGRTRSQQVRHNSPTSNSSSDSGSSSSSAESSAHHLSQSFQTSRTRPYRSMKSNAQSEKSIYQNPAKLMYYIEEPNKGKGYIKELCFSADGRIICSPYDVGVRLLGFRDDCSEYPYYNAIHERKCTPRELVQLCTLKSHSDIVLCSKFSPHHPLLVTGCQSGKIVWHTPYL